MFKIIFKKSFETVQTVSVLKNVQDNIFEVVLEIFLLKMTLKPFFEEVDLKVSVLKIILEKFFESVLKV